MHGAHEFLSALAVVLCVAAVTTVAFQRLKQPVVLGYLLAGLIVGPYVPIPLVADRETIQTLSEIGVILLMYSLGLEFSIRKLVASGPSAALTAVIQSSIMVWAGFLLGRALGWTVLESVFAGAVIAISSTTIIAKAFDEEGIRGKMRDLVVGVLIVEDLIGILLMTVLTTLAAGSDMSAATLLGTGGRLAAFLAGLLAVGMLVVPAAVRAINALGRPETIVVANVGFCFGVALLAQAFGYSVALGAFLAGSLVAESGEEKQVEHLIVPVRDLFAAIFFVSVGMLIDPTTIAEHWVAVVSFTAVVIVGKLVGVTAGAFLSGNGIPTSIQAGMSLAQIGEFSFIIAGLGLSLGATRDFLYPIAVAVSAITTLTTPWLIRVAGPVAGWIDRTLPQPLQTFVMLYGTWLERMRESSRQQASRPRRLAKLLLLDVSLVLAVAVAAAVWTDDAAALASARLGISADVSVAFVLGAAGLLSLPLLVAVFRISRALGVSLSQAALPPVSKGELDLALAPRRVLIVTLQVAVVLAIGLPVAALVQPFVAGWTIAATFGAVLVVLGVVFWRSAANLQGHVKAGAEVILEALMKQAAKPASAADEHALDDIKRLMPGIGEPVPLRLAPHSAAVGRTLAQINLRGLTGATVLAIARHELGVIAPASSEVLQGGDVLAIAGTHDAVAAAVDILRAERQAPEAAVLRPPG